MFRGSFLSKGFPFLNTSSPLDASNSRHKGMGHNQSLIQAAFFSLLPRILGKCQLASSHNWAHLSWKNIVQNMEKRIRKLGIYNEES